MDKNILLLLLLGCVALAASDVGGDENVALKRMQLIQMRQAIIDRMAQEKSSDPEYVQKVYVFWRNYNACSAKTPLEAMDRGEYQHAIESFLILQGYKEDRELLKIKQALRALPAV